MKKGFWLAWLAGFCLGLLLVFVVGCARVPGNVIPHPVPGRDVEAADYVTHINSSYEWEHSQWYRIGDPIGTVGFFIVSMNGSICLDQDGTWAIVQHGEPVHCAGGWRYKTNGMGTRGSRITRAEH